jgi:Fe-S cluster biogenesis protein NfuA
MTDEAKSELQKAQVSLKDRVSEVIGQIRPYIQADGGDIELVTVDDNGKVSIRFHGQCRGCPMSAMTLKMGVERHLKEKVPEVSEVVSVS